MSRVDKTKPAPMRLIQESGQIEREDHGPHDIRTALETLLCSAKALSDNKVMGHVLAGVDKIPALEDEIRRRDAQEEIDKSARQQALEDYAIQRDNWNVEREQFQEDIKRLEKDLSQEKKEVESLRATGEQRSRRISSLEESLAKSSLNEEGNQKQIQGLIKAVEAERHKNAALNDDLKQSTTEAAKARAEGDEIQKAYEKAKKQADWHKHELDAAASLTVPIVDNAKV